jgi:hypothetical protein
VSIQEEAVCKQQLITALAAIVVGDDGTLRCTKGMCRKSVRKYNGIICSSEACATLPAYQG